MTKNDINNRLSNIYQVVWGYDVPHPTNPEYVEWHHKCQVILKHISMLINDIKKEKTKEEETKGITKCKYCETTDNLISESFVDESTGRDMIVDLRFDLDHNQLDVYHGFTTFRMERGEWTDGIDINYCPFCGRDLNELTKED